MGIWKSPTNRGFPLVSGFANRSISIYSYVTPVSFCVDKETIDDSAARD
jgi:hypothetical protein